MDLMKEKPEFFEQQKPFLDPQFVSDFENLMNRKSEKERNDLMETGIIHPEDQ